MQREGKSTGFLFFSFQFSAAIEKNTHFTVRRDKIVKRLKRNELIFIHFGFSFVCYVVTQSTEPQFDSGDQRRVNGNAENKEIGSFISKLSA